MPSIHFGGTRRKSNAMSPATQDVAVEQKVEVGKAKQQQPEQPAQLQRDRRRPARPRPFQENDHPGAEQQREQAAQLAVDEQVLEQPDPLFARTQGTVSRRPGMLHAHRAQAVEVGEHDAHHREAADQVKAFDAALGLRLVGRRGPFPIDRFGDCSGHSAFPPEFAS
jgi:hypothetical protein